MSVPTHGYGCQTVRCYKTKCKQCQREVFYYECSCRSKVFFNSLGDWEKHKCRRRSRSGSFVSVDNTRLSKTIRKRLLQESQKLMSKLTGGRSPLKSTPPLPTKGIKPSVPTAQKVDSSSIPLKEGYVHSNGTISKKPLEICDVCLKEVRVDRMGKHTLKCLRKGKRK